MNAGSYCYYLDHTVCNVALRISLIITNSNTLTINIAQTVKHGYNLIILAALHLICIWGSLRLVIRISIVNVIAFISWMSLLFQLEEITFQGPSKAIWICSNDSYGTWTVFSGNWNQNFIPHVLLVTADKQLHQCLCN